MNNEYKVQVALLVEFVVDDQHEMGKRMKYMVTRDPEQASHMLAATVDSVLDAQNKVATWATANVVAASDLNPS